MITRSAIGDGSCGTDSPTKDLIADTRANLEHVRKTCKMPQA